jgi:cephalosporin hydroxylase
LQVIFLRRKAKMMDYKLAKGWLKDEERECLYYAACLCQSRVLNIGVEMGASVAALHTGNPYFLDAIDIDLSNLDFAKDDLPGVIFIEADSHTYDFSDRTYGLIFIDGDHSYGGVKADIENILPQLEKGGTVIFHDCYDYADPTAVHRLCPGVNQAVEEWYEANFSEFTELESVGTMRIFSKGVIL